MLHLSMIILLRLLPLAESTYCDDFDWTGSRVKAIDDCEILRPEMTVHLERLTNKPNCLQRIAIKIFKNQSDFSEQNVGTPGSTSFLQITNSVPAEERCKETVVHISTVVQLRIVNRPGRLYSTFFSLTPQNCITADDVNFQKDCSGEVTNSDSTPATPNPTGINQSTGSLVFPVHIKICGLF